MPGNINFIETTTEELCNYCGRRKISENDKYYRVLIGENPSEIIVCELCKGGFSHRFLESGSKSYAAHLLFYVSRSFSEAKNRVGDETFGEMACALEDYEIGNYSACFRSIGLVAEQITNRLYAEKIDKSAEANKIRWEEKLGKLLDSTRKTGDISGLAAIYQLFSLKVFRNNADHPSEYQITAEDARLGLASISYLIQWKLSNEKNQLLKKKLL